MKRSEINRFIVKAFEKFNLSLAKWDKSPEGRIGKLLKAYDIDAVIDVGANVGQYATMLRKKMQFEGTIFSFEPLGQEFRQLRKAACADEHWNVYNYALGDRCGKARLNVSGNSVSSSLLPATDRLLTAEPSAAYRDVQDVDERTLDSVFESLDVDCERCWLKIDAQGYERHVLAGSANVLEKINTVQVELSLSPTYGDEGSFKPVLEELHEKRLRLVHLVPGFFDKATGELLEVDAIFHRI